MCRNGPSFNGLVTGGFLPKIVLGDEEWMLIPSVLCCMADKTQEHLFFLLQVSKVITLC